MPSKSYEFVSRDACPACGSRDLEMLYRSSFSGPVIGTFIRDYYSIDPGFLGDRPYQLDRCQSCHLTFQHHVGSAELLADLYTHWVPDTDNPESDARYRDDVRNFRLSRDAHEIMAVASYLGKPVQQLQTLDYGMGWALWARIASQLGCQSYGSDLSRPRMEYAANHGVISVSDDDIPAGRFDLINTEQVFEHVPNPSALLRRLADALRPGGIIKISVPAGRRVDDIVQRLKGGSGQIDHWTIMPVHPLEHVNTFVPSAIMAMAGSAGLRLVRPSYYHRFAFLRHRRTLNLLKPKAAARELIRPWYEYHNPNNLYVWLRATDDR